MRSVAVKLIAETLLMVACSRLSLASHCIIDANTSSCIDGNLTAIPEDIPIQAVVLELQNNSITVIGNNSFSTLVNLQTLNLGLNEIHAIEHDAFRNLTKLQHLRLNSNDLHSVPDCFIKDLAKLLKLKLSHNAIQTVGKDSFVNLVSLEHLDLSHNLITSIDKGALRFQTKLVGLYLEGNQLKTLGGQIFADKPLEVVSLADNNWNCDCALLNAVGDKFAVNITCKPDTLRSFAQDFNCETQGSGEAGVRTVAPVIDDKTTKSTTAPANALTTTHARATATKTPENAPTTTKASKNAPTTTTTAENAPPTTTAPENAPTTTTAPKHAPTTTTAPANAPTTTKTPAIKPPKDGHQNGSNDKTVTTQKAPQHKGNAAATTTPSANDKVNADDKGNAAKNVKPTTSAPDSSVNGSSNDNTKSTSLPEVPASKAAGHAKGPTTPAAPGSGKPTKAAATQTTSDKAEGSTPATSVSSTATQTSGSNSDATKKVSVGKGKPFMTVCKTDSKSVISWKLNGTLLTSKGNYAIMEKSLKVKNFNSSLAGTYCCFNGETKISCTQATVKMRSAKKGTTPAVYVAVAILIVFAVTVAGILLFRRYRCHNPERYGLLQNQNVFRPVVEVPAESGDDYL